MTQENKKLLLKDLSARLPYGVKMHCGEDIIMTLRQIDENCFCECWENEDFKCHSTWMLPYLRPMASMTAEEKEELNEVTVINCNEFEGCSTLFDEEGFDWLNAHHFDYRGLIEKGLALEAPEGMYKKNKHEIY